MKLGPVDPFDYLRDETDPADPARAELSDPSAADEGFTVEELRAKPAVTRRDAYEPPDHRQILASAPSFFIPPPFDWRHPITGKFGWQPSLELIAFGMYVKRGRYLARMTQDQVAEGSGVDQGQISRLERALAPWTRAEDLVSIGKALGRALPLGFCPHTHWCEWQPAPPPPPEKDWLAEAQAFNEKFGITAGE